MQGHGYDRVGASEDLRAAQSHEGGQLTRERSSSVVLQRVNDGAERAFVCTDGSRSCHGARETSASRTPAWSGVIQEPGRQRIAADVAERRCERKNRAPARSADRAFSRSLERTLTDGAGRGENNSEQCVQIAAHGSSEGYVSGTSMRSALPHSRSRP